MALSSEIGVSAGRPRISREVRLTQFAGGYTWLEIVGLPCAFGAPNRELVFTMARGTILLLFPEFAEVELLVVAGEDWLNPAEGGFCA